MARQQAFYEQCESHAKSHSTNSHQFACAKSFFFFFPFRKAAKTQTVSALREFFQLSMVVGWFLRDWK